jgi:hypothetical protein
LLFCLGFHALVTTLIMFLEFWSFRLPIDFHLGHQFANRQYHFVSESISMLRRVACKTAVWYHKLTRLCRDNLCCHRNYSYISGLWREFKQSFKRKILRRKIKVGPDSGDTNGEGEGKGKGKGERKNSNGDTENGGISSTLHEVVATVKAARQLSKRAKKMRQTTMHIDTDQVQKDAMLSANSEMNDRMVKMEESISWCHFPTCNDLPFCRSSIPLVHLHKVNHCRCPPRAPRPARRTRQP